MALTRFPIETTDPRIQVTLPVGRHVLELVVEDSAGLRSAPDQVVIEVRQEVVLPTISGILPVSATPGSKVEAVISGTNLSGATTVKFTSSTIGAAIGVGGTATSLPVVLTIATDAVAGSYGFTVTTPAGTVSSPAEVTFSVYKAPVLIPPRLITPITEVTPITEIRPTTEVKLVTPITEVKPITEITPITEVKPITEITPITEVKPITEITPITEVKLITEVKPITEITPITEVKAITAVTTPITEVKAITAVTTPITEVKAITAVTTPVTEVKAISAVATPVTEVKAITPAVTTTPILSNVVSETRVVTPVSGKTATKKTTATAKTAVRKTKK